MIDWSNSSPATLNDLLVTIPPSDIIATSVVPPPISTIILPVGSSTGSPAPIAAAIGSSINITSLAPACLVASSIALLSTSVTPEGKHTIILGLVNALLFVIFSMNLLSIVWVTSKSAITPSFNGLIATMFPGVLPIICLASVPTANDFFVKLFIATTEGSLNTIPFPLTNTRVFAVPKSIPMSFVIPKLNKPIFNPLS